VIDRRAGLVAGAEDRRLEIEMNGDPIDVIKRHRVSSFDE